MPSLSSRFATDVMRLALPVRSPYPLMQPCRCVAPASTAAIEFATAHPVSLWAWMPRRAPVAMASVTISPTWCGSMPPLVSQSTTTSAPASAAVRTTSSA